MSGSSRGQQAGSPRQPESLSSSSSSAFPECFCEQCMPRWGRCEAGPPAPTTAPARPPCTHAGTHSCWVLLSARLSCEVVPVLHLWQGDLGCLLHRCQAWREENVLGLLLCSKCHIWPQQKMGVGQTGWGVPKGALRERMAVPAAGLALSHCQLSWRRVDTCLKQPAVPAQVPLVGYHSDVLRESSGSLRCSVVL